MNTYDYLIVGAGLYGSTFAWRAKQDKKSCIVIDKRPYPGGNLYCENIEGIIVHKYGPHIFHTSNKETWNFVNQFTEFIPYTLQTVANYNGELYNLPFNMNTFYQLWGAETPQDAQKIINSQRLENNCNNLEEQALNLFGRDIYNKLIKGYSEKQWGIPCNELPSYIVKRLPIRFNFDNNYFNDIYQGIPINGYNSLINGLLEGIPLETNTDFFSIKDWKKVAKKLVYTGPIDKYFNYTFGPLRWRSLYWETQVLNVQNYQGVAIMNFTGKEPYTRIIEHKHFSKCITNKTVITKEFPIKEGDPYYPVDIDNPYSLITDPDVIFGGRLAEYKYYNMDQIIEKALYDYSRQ